MSLQDYDTPLLLDDDFHISIAESAVFLDVPEEQVWSWIAEGHLASRVSVDGETRVALDEVMELVGMRGVRKTG